MAARFGNTRFSACELGSCGGLVGGSDVFVTNWLQGVVAMVFLYLRWRFVEHLCSICAMCLANARRFELGNPFGLMMLAWHLSLVSMLLARRDEPLLSVIGVPRALVGPWSHEFDATRGFPGEGPAARLLGRTTADWLTELVRLEGMRDDAQVLDRLAAYRCPRLPFGTRVIYNADRHLVCERWLALLARSMGWDAARRVLTVDNYRRAQQSFRNRRRGGSRMARRTSGSGNEQSAAPNLMGQRNEQSVASAVGHAVPFAVGTAGQSMQDRSEWVRYSGTSFVPLGQGLRSTMSWFMCPLIADACELGHLYPVTVVPRPDLPSVWATIAHWAGSESPVMNDKFAGALRHYEQAPECFSPNLGRLGGFLADEITRYHMQIKDVVRRGWWSRNDCCGASKVHYICSRCRIAFCVKHCKNGFQPRGLHWDGGVSPRCGCAFGVNASHHTMPPPYPMNHTPQLADQQSTDFCYLPSIGAAYMIEVQPEDGVFMLQPVFLNLCFGRVKQLGARTICVA